jgi:hypothetical protein
MGVKEFAAKLGMAGPNLVRTLNPRHNPVTLRAHTSGGRGVKLADVTTADMDGYANGPNNRMRLYAYEGKSFRPVWMPENV